MLKKAGHILLSLYLIFLCRPIYAIGYGDVSPIKTFYKLIMYIIIFIAVIFVSLYGTKLVAKNFKGIAGSKYIKILDVMNIPGGSKIVITKINNKVYIMATSNGGTNVLDIIDEHEFPVIDEDIGTYLSKYLDKDNLSYDKIKKNIKLRFDRFHRKKDKEDKKNEEQD